MFYKTILSSFSELNAYCIIFQNANQFARLNFSHLLELNAVYIRNALEKLFVFTIIAVNQRNEDLRSFVSNFRSSDHLNKQFHQHIHQRIRHRHAHQYLLPRLQDQQNLPKRDHQSCWHRLLFHPKQASLTLIYHEKCVDIISRVKTHF